MAAFTETRQGSGFPDWEIVRGSDRLFDWYNPETVTELGFVDDDGRSVRLAVSDRNRLVIRAALVGSDRSVNLRTVPGLVRRFYGSDCFGHTDWFVAGS
jgi:hypothetical protein